MDVGLCWSAEGVERIVFPGCCYVAGEDEIICDERGAVGWVWCLDTPLDVAGSDVDGVDGAVAESVPDCVEVWGDGPV